MKADMRGERPRSGSEPGEPLDPALETLFAQLRAGAEASYPGPGLKSGSSFGTLDPGWTGEAKRRFLGMATAAAVCLVLSGLALQTVALSAEAIFDLAFILF